MTLLTKEDIIAAIRELAERLGRAPRHREVKTIGIHERQLRRLFGTFDDTLHACGLKRAGRGLRVSLDDLFKNWVGVVRALGRLPSRPDYDAHGGYSYHPVERHFGRWSKVPEGMLLHGNQAGLWADWPDVFKIVSDAVEERRAAEEPQQEREHDESWLIPGAPTYGEPIISPALAHAPANEAGVLVLFGSLAEGLGYLILHVQSGFPDCIALRRVEANRWQLVKIEMEYESRNFLQHGHDAAACDMIVCWVHNWPECPLRVLELSKFVGRR